MKINKIHIIDVAFALSFLTFGLARDMIDYTGGVYFIGMLFLYYAHLYFKVRRDKSLVIFWIFSATYPIYMSAYFIFKIPYHYLTDTQSMSNTVWALSLHGLFLSIMFFGKERRSINRCLDVVRFNSAEVYWILIAFVWAMFPLSLTLYPPLAGEVYTGEVNSSIWIEYCLIFFIVIYLYSDSNYKLKVLHWTMVIYLIYPMLYSRRLQFIMYVLLIFFLFYEGKVSRKLVMTGAIIAFVGMKLFESIRVGVDISLYQALYSIDDEGVLGGNQGGVVLASTVYLQLIEDGVFDAWTRLKSFVGFLLTTVLPASFNFEEAYVNFYALKFRPLPGNGGFPGVYTYLWGGYFLLVIFALILRKALLKNTGRVGLAVTAFVFCTFPRWHSYNLIILIKLLFWMILLLSVCDFLTKNSRLKYGKMNQTRSAKSLLK